MSRRSLPAVAGGFVALFVASVDARGAEVAFDPSEPDGGPFPSDLFTTPDDRQLTGRRIDLPWDDS